MLIAGRDDEWERWLAPSAEEPQPAACIAVGDEVVGWVDFDTNREWLPVGGVNIGYNVFAKRRGRGYATRAVQLLLHRLALEGRHHIAAMLIDAENKASVAVAARARFTLRGNINASRYFVRQVPPVSYSDGTIAIRRQHPDDLDADLAAKDDEQIDRLWLPGERERWEAMMPAEQRTHALRGLQANHDSFGRGPKWTFAVDAGSTTYVAYIDCDLANPDVPAGEANISYSAHPDHRGKGYVSRAVRLILRFLSDHTATRQAHLVIDPANSASLRVARAVGAVEIERFVNQRGHVMCRYVLPVGSASAS